MPTQSPLLRRLLKARTAPKALVAQPLAAQTEPSFSELSPFEKGIDVISRPLYTTASAAHALLTGGNPFKAAYDGFVGTRRTTYGDVLKAAGFNDPVARAALGFAADVLLDPLTYVGVGAVGKAGTITAKGVPTALSKIGSVTRDIAIAEKTVQAERVLQKGAQLGRTGLPRLSEARMATLLGKSSPEAKALQGVASPARVIGETYGKQALEKAVTGSGHRIAPSLAAKLPSVTRDVLVAPKAITFAGMPVVKTATLKKATAPVGQVYRAAEKIPIAGDLLRVTRQFAQSAGRAVQKAFSAKTGIPEFDVARTAARDLENFKNARSQDWWIQFEKKLEQVAGKEGVEKARTELGRAIEGVEKEFTVLEKPAAKIAALQKVTAELEGNLQKLAAREGTAAAVEGVVGKRIGALEALKKSGKIEQRALQTVAGQEPAIAKQAERLVKRQALEQRLGAQGGDIISAIQQKHGRLYWKGKAGGNIEELAHSGIPKNLIADPKKLGQGIKASSIDEVAASFGMTSEELIDEISKAAAARKQGVQVAPEILQQAKQTLIERQVGKLVSHDTKRIESQVARLKERLEKAKSNPERMVLQSEIASKQAALSLEKAKLAQAEREAIPVTYKKRVEYESPISGVKGLAEEYRGRMKEILKSEQKTLPLPPEERAYYLPHYMRPEVQDALVTILRQDAARVLKPEFSGALKSSMRRTATGGVEDLKIADLIEAGAIDTAKLQKVLEEKGLPMSGVDMLAFEKDPVVAGLKRELSSNRAIESMQFQHEILNSPSFVKSKADFADPEDLKRLKLTVSQHPDHAIYIPSKTYIEFFRNAAEKEAMRRGAEPDLFISMLKEVFEPEVDQLLKKAAEVGKTGKIEAYVIPKEIAEHLSKAYALPKKPEWLKNFLDQYDPALAYWKWSATSIRPAFHVRNAISNFWQNFLAGVNPKAYGTAGMYMKGASAGKLLGVGKYSPEQVLQLAERFGVLKSGLIGKEIGEGIEQAVRPTGLTPARGRLKGIPGAGLLYPSGPLGRAGRKFGEGVEDHARLANFIDGLSKGMDPQSAAMRVKKYLFDYQDLSVLEREVMKRVIPFYTFTRKSIPLALETLVTQPGKVAVLGKARQEAEDSVGSLNHEYVADYINQSFGVPIRKNEKGEYEYFLLKGYIPTVDLAKLDAQELLGMLSPAIKAPAEQLLNTDFYRMKPISKFPGEKVEFMGIPMPVRLAHLMRNVVIMAQLDRELFREGATPGKFAASELSLRLQTQNPVDQMRRYVLTTQVELGEIKRQMERARARGQDQVADQLEARLVLLQARRDQAKSEVLKLDPNAFKTSRATTPKKTPAPTYGSLKRQAHQQIDLARLLSPAGAKK